MHIMTDHLDVDTRENYLMLRPASPKSWLRSLGSEGKTIANRFSKVAKAGNAQSHPCVMQTVIKMQSLVARLATSSTGDSESDVLPMEVEFTWSDNLEVSAGESTLALYGSDDVPKAFKQNIVPKEFIAG